MKFILGPLVTGLVALLALPLCAQDLAPRAYVITPIGLNAITLTWSYFNGGVNFNGAVPITGATGIYNVSTFTYYRCFSFFGRSANLAASLPYAVGTFQGQVQQQQRSVYRSGLVDFGARFSVNLMGGPAMPADKFARWKVKRTNKGFEGLHRKKANYSKYMDGLTEKHQQVFSLRYEYGLTVTEIASRLGIDRSTVYEHIGAIDKKLQQFASSKKRIATRAKGGPEE